MSKLDKLKDYLPDIYDDITEIEELLETEATELDELDLNIISISNDIYIDIAEDDGLKRYEKIFKIVVPVGATLEERRSVIKSRLRGIDKLSATVIKNISLAYQNGEVNVSFLPSNIIINFLSVIGVPSNINQLKNYLNERKPSHLGIIYLYRYLIINEVQAMTITEMQNTQLNKFSPFI